jgi:carbamoyl-phosphate synthase large subunit
MSTRLARRLPKIGYPLLVCAAFALGGLVSVLASDQDELKARVNQAFVNSQQVIVGKNLRGLRELEYEVVRDGSDTCFTVCNIENFDPIGFHAGDSIVIAPSQALTNEEHISLRECVLKVILHIGVVGECNVLSAVDPKSTKFRIIYNP